MPGPGPISHEMECFLPPSLSFTEPTPQQPSLADILKGLWFQFLDLKEKETNSNRDRLIKLQREEESVAFAIAVIKMTNYPELTQEECDWYLAQAECDPSFALLLEQHIADDKYHAFLDELAPIRALVERKALIT